MPRRPACSPRSMFSAATHEDFAPSFHRQEKEIVNMEAYFNELASLLDRSLGPGEVYTCAFDAEASDFVRMNSGKVRQPGSVLQRYLRLHLIRGQRHAERCFALSGDLARDRVSVASAFSWLRETLSEVPDDPHLSYSTDSEARRSS